MPRRMLVPCLALALSIGGPSACGDDDDDNSAAGDADADSDADSDTDSDGDADGDSDGDADSDSDADGDCDDSTIAHPDSGALWQRCSVGATWDWDGSECTCMGGITSTFAWDEIGEICPDGFRAPTAEELMTLLGGCDDWASIAAAGEGSCDPCGDSAICQQLFPGEGRFFWSTSEHAGDTSEAFNVGFNLGLVEAWEKTNTYYVRCVEE